MRCMDTFRLQASFPAPRTLRLTLTGHLDAEAARLLLSTAATAAHAVHRLELDLGPLAGFTGDGAWALASCRKLSSLLRDGVVVHPCGGPGRELVAASLALAS